MITSRSGHLNRRRFVTASALGGAAMLAAGRLPLVGNRAVAPAALAQKKSAEVPMYRGNAARTGVMPGPAPDDANGVEIIWQYDIDSFMLFSPAVADGIAYVVNQGESDDGSTISAVSVDDGSELWRIATDDYLSSPAVADGVVFSGGSSPDFDGSLLYALNAEDGTELWRFAAEGWLTDPAVVDGVIFVGNDEGTLYAVDAVDGTERWRFATASKSVSMPAVADGVVYAGGSDGTLYAVNALDGTEVWRLATTSGGSLDVPVVVDGVVCVGGYQLFCAVNASDGTERWRIDTFGGHVRSPVVTEGIAIAGGSGLYAVNAADGSLRWQFVPDFGSASSAVVADGIVYTGGDAGTIFALDRETGNVRWSLQTPSDAVLTPVVVDGMLLAGSYRGNLYAIGASGGQVAGLGVGTSARVTEPASLRGAPSAVGVERAALTPGTVVTITGEPVTTDGAAWWLVTVESSGAQGWVEASKLEPWTTSAETSAPDKTDIPAGTVDLLSLLPSIAEVPGGLVETGRFARPLSDVVANYTDPAATAQLFTGWGWQGNAVTSFALPSGQEAQSGQINGVYVSIHQFGSPDAAREALDFSLTEQAAGTALQEISTRPLGEYTRTLYGPMDYGNETTVLVQQGDLLIRVSAAMLDGDPTAQTLLVTEIIVRKVTSAASTGTVFTGPDDIDEGQNGQVLAPVDGAESSGTTAKQTSNVVISTSISGYPFLDACYILVGYSDVACVELPDPVVRFYDVPLGTYTVRQTADLGPGRWVDDFTIHVTGSGDWEGFAANVNIAGSPSSTLA